MDHRGAGDDEERQQQVDDRDDEQDHVLSSPPEEDGNQEPLEAQGQGGRSRSSLLSLETDKESVVQQQQQLPSPSSSWRAAAASFRESLSRSLSFSLSHQPDEQEKNDEVELRWAAIERLPTVDSVSTAPRPTTSTAEEPDDEGVWDCGPRSSDRQEEEAQLVSLGPDVEPLVSSMRYLSRERSKRDL
jgi:hypothetical protein